MTDLTVTVVWAKGYVICYMTVKIHLEGLNDLIPSERLMTLCHCIFLVEETDQNKLKRCKNEEERPKKDAKND